LVHLNRIEPRNPKPGESVKIIVQSGSDIDVRQVVFCYTTDGSIPADGVGKEIAFNQTSVEWDTLNWGYLTTWEVCIPAQSAGTVVRYKIKAKLSNNPEVLFAENGKVFSYLVDDKEVPSWAHDAILYQIIIDRFYPGDRTSWKDADGPDDFFGGTLQGVIDKLDYLRSLGINCIWLSPCFSSPSHHGYDATDLFSIEPRLGTLNDLKELVSRAHQSGIRVILDFVANHISNRHPKFLEASTDKSSKYHTWFMWKEWPHDYDSFFGVHELPEINLDNPEARKHVIDAALFWISECHIDGFRLDYAYGVPHDFWVDFRQATKALNPDLWLFGEVVETAELQRSFEGKLDGSLDFLLLQALRGLFAFHSWDLREFDTFLNAHETFFPTTFSRPSFLDNHDMNRFLWVVNGNTSKLRLAALCQFTLAGAPIIYYGTEVGISQDQEIWREEGGFLEESRLPMLWNDEQDTSLLDYYRALIQFRKAHPVLWKGNRKTVHVDAEAGTYAYSRRNGTEELMVVLNNSDHHRAVRIETELNEGLIHQRTYPRKNGKVEIQLGPYSGVVLGKKPVNY
jgi:cyclomaltodextrinase / maltogenic alpha-amylase / neopullulanase